MANASRHHRDGKTRQNDLDALFGESLPTGRSRGSASPPASPVNPVRDRLHPLSLCEESERQYRGRLAQDRLHEFVVIAHVTWDSAEQRQLSLREAAERYWIAQDEERAWQSSFVVRRQLDLALINAQAAIQALSSDETALRSELSNQFFEEFRLFETEELRNFLTARREEVARMDVPLHSPQPPTGHRRDTAAPPRRKSLPEPQPMDAHQKHSDEHRAPSRPQPRSAVVQKTAPFPFLEEAEASCRRAVAEAWDALLGRVALIRDMTVANSPWSRLVELQAAENSQRRLISSDFAIMLQEAAQILEALMRQEIDVRGFRRERTPLAVDENRAWIAARDSEQRRLSRVRISIEAQEQAERVALRDREAAHVSARHDLETRELRDRFELEHTELSERRVTHALEQHMRWPLEKEAMARIVQRQLDAVTLTWTEESYASCYLAELRYRQVIFVDERSARDELTTLEASGFLAACRDNASNDAVRRKLQKYDDDLLLRGNREAIEAALAPKQIAA